MSDENDTRSPSAENDDMLAEFNRIDFDAIEDAEAARLEYRFTQIESQPAPIRSPESEEEEDWRCNFQSISFTSLDDVWNRSFSYLFPSEPDIDQLMTGEVVLGREQGMSKFDLLVYLFIQV